jgi:uroporphyrin-III C-methyltransferase / precorrin-2 dehydrogenase / sirohydrochlorin ferrochelatase
MKTFPMFLQMAGRRVVIVGGGEQAAQKARLMLKTEARLVLIAPDLDDELAGLVASGRVEWHHTLSVDILRDNALVFIATGCPGLDAAVHGLARAAGALVNVVDQPALCDAITPSIVDRDPVVVAIGTEGNAPVLARQIKSRLEVMLEPELGSFAALAGRLRGAAAARIPKAQRRAFWDWVFDGPARAALSRGAGREAATLLKDAIAAGGAPAQAGSITLVGAGPGAADLLTLRALRHLQEADVIFYDRLIDPGVLELARRDAERVFVGKEVGANIWPQDRINAVIVAAARQGKRVVRLKSGDPGIFGRATEELEAARSVGVAVEIVPGITAASAACASLGRSLTERGQTDRVMLATATCRPGDPDPDWAEMLRPGTTLALYMGMRKAAELTASLRRAGVPMDLEVAVVSSASTLRETVAMTTLGALPGVMQACDLLTPSVILIRWPKRTRAESRPHLACAAGAG